jgi:hypothetical protein
MLTAIRTLLIQDQLTVPEQGAVSVDSALRLDDRTLILQLNPSQLVCVDLFCQRTSVRPISSPKDLAKVKLSAVQRSARALFFVSFVCIFIEREICSLRFWIEDRLKIHLFTKSLFDLHPC